MKNRVNLLWTGGWDSTFRLLQLAEQDIEIQPIYVIDRKRSSIRYEKDAMKKILEKIRERKEEFPAEIIETKYYELDWIYKNCKNEEISEAFRFLKDKYQLGSQYEWFALICSKEGIKIETGIEGEETSKGRASILGEGELVPVENDFLTDRVCVVPKGGSKAAELVFGNLIFGILDCSKKDAEKISEEKGWLDIMKITWFCHNPIKGEPCGMCHPCMDAMALGMDWRMPARSQWRYQHRNKSWYRLFAKVRRKINKLKSK